jgi:concanavalin A-like lectin/glucanase superfamily protein
MYLRNDEKNDNGTGTATMYADLKSKESKIMKKSILLVIATIIFSGAFSIFAQTETQDLLPNAGFKTISIGDSTPVNGWKFNYNKEVKGTFIKDASFKGKGPVLKLVNPLANKGITLNSGNFEIKKAGKYRASIWIKAGPNTKKLPEKKFTTVMRLIRKDWKNRLDSLTQSMQKGWLKYEYDLHIPESQISTYYFRIDLAGTGTFYVAGPSIKLVGETETAKKKIKKPLKETARFSFDKTLDKDTSKTSPSKSVKATLKQGFMRQAVTVSDGGFLSYPIADLLKGESGAIALWIRTSKDPVPTFVPTDPVGLTINGLNQLGKKVDIFKIRTSSPGNFITFNSAYGRRGVSFVRPRKKFFGKEWRHFIFSWDKELGLKVYLDGRLFLASSKTKGFKNSLPNMTLENLRIFTATGKNPEENASFDEVRLFNRELTDDEALRLYEKYVPAYPVLLDYAVIAGSKKPFRVRMLHKKGAPPVVFKIRAVDMSDLQLFEETLKVDKSGDYAVSFHPSKPGDYRLFFLFDNKHIRTFEVTAITPKSITNSMPESIAGKVKTKLVEEINCAENYPASRYLDDGEVRVTNSPIGKYRESTHKSYNYQKPNGFVYNLTVKNPEKPHWLEIEYPDDKPRVFYVVVEEKLDNMGWGKNKFTNSYSLDTLGVANGMNNPVTGKFVRKRLLFWPDSEKILVGCFGYKTYQGQSGPALKSIRLYENDGALPRLKVNPPLDMPQRAIGNWNEDGGMPAGCWFNRYIHNKGPSFGFFLEKFKRRVEYVRFMGQNQIIIQVYRNGDMTGMQGIFPSQYNNIGMIPGWACLAATIFERETIPFYLEFADYVGTSRIVGRDKISQDAFEAAAKGLDSIEMMTADGTVASTSKYTDRLNFLCPSVRKVFLDRIRFFRDQFSIYDTFKGILLYRSSNITFKNEKTGYGDYTISLFEKETGIKIPVKNKGMDRFSKRYKWLKSSQVWNKWVDWRCAKVKKFLLALSGELNAGKKKGLKIILTQQTETKKTPFISENLKNYPGKINLVEGFRTMGIDIPSLSRESSLIIELISAPNYGLLYNKGEEKNLDAFWYSDNFARLLKSSDYPALNLSRHANMEIFNCASSAIKKYWWRRGAWGNNGGFHCFSSAMPDNKYLPQTLAWSLANGDLWYVSHGWWGNPENGAHNKFQKFYQAFRSIPAVHFKEIPGVNDPVMARQYNNSDGKSGWFYLVNMQCYKTKVKITFDSEMGLTDTVFNSSQKIDGKVLEKELEPYQVLCYRSDKPVKIIKVEQIVPPYVITEMTQVVADLKIGAKQAPSEQAELLTKTAEKMLKEKRYSALYYLSRSYSALQLLKEAGN